MATVRFTVECAAHGEMSYMSLSRVYRCDECGKIITREEATALASKGYRSYAPSPIPIIVT